MQFLALSVSTHASMVRGARVYTHVAGACMVRQTSSRRPMSPAVVQCATTRTSASYAAMAMGSGHGLLDDMFSWNGSKNGGRDRALIGQKSAL